MTNHYHMLCYIVMLPESTILLPRVTSLFTRGLPAITMWAWPHS